MAVAIIGGGLAGLSCAYRLKREGIEATVFEESFSAGRSRLERVAGFDGFVLDAGAQYLLMPDVFQSTFKLSGELGMSGDILAIEPIAGQLYKRRIYHHRVASATGLLSFKGLGILDKAMLPKMAFLLSRYGPTLNFQQPGLGVSHDDETVAAFVKRELSQNILNHVAGPLISTLFLYPSHETSKLLYLLLAKHMQNTQMYTLRGGIGRLSLKLATQVTVVGTGIREIERDKDEFIIEGRRFSGVVIAVPGDAVLSIRGVREMLSAEDVAFFEGCPYQRAMTVFVATTAPVEGRCYALSIPAVEKMTAATIAFQDFMDPSRVPAGAGLLAPVAPA
jgi:protoporphyrinogen oxidase